MARALPAPLLAIDPSALPGPALLSGAQKAPPRRPHLGLVCRAAFPAIHTHISITSPLTAVPLFLPPAAPALPPLPARCMGASRGITAQRQWPSRYSIFQLSLLPACHSPLPPTAAARRPPAIPALRLARALLQHA
ncbi:hypothetical protein FB451DRAFT_1394862 [Mycena latifolia]|nr:hypothetical protein FB451DRAFT_1406755 [Mycena latifolia]KAJ7480800.1 hypothetical protein FB451DRAFT_1394862 [Mycena latifolia]